MIGRLLRAIPSRVGTPLSRVETVRTLLRFWATHGADWMPFQEQLERYVERHASFHFHETVVQRILDCLVEGRILHRVLVPPRTVQYRLDRQFADPTWPGFAREIDDLLVDPVPWSTADGRIFKVGARQPEDPYPYLYLLPTRPHYFATHAWVRAWIHAFHLGFLGDQPSLGLEVVRRAARDAPLTALRILYAGPDDALTRSARELIEASPFHRSYSTLFARPNSGQIPRSHSGKAGLAFSEAALETLHLLCGHLPLEPPANRRGRPPKVRHPEGFRRVLRERYVYEVLDLAGLIGLHIHQESLPAPIKRRANDFWDATRGTWSASPIRPHGGQSFGSKAFDVSLGLLAPQIRAAPPAVRRSMTDHALAWPGGGPSVAW